MKKYLIAILAVLLLAGGLAGIKALQVRRMIDQKSKMVMPPAVVTSIAAHTESWGESLSSVGSLTAVQGVEVAAVLAGKVVAIAFTPGSQAKAGELLVRQDITTETAQLREAETAATLAKTNLARYQALLARKSVSQAEFDNAEARFQEATAQVDNIRTVIDKKQIRAPFGGRLGIRKVNLGQVLKEGDPIVSLQALDPIFVDFSLPQQQLARLHIGIKVRVSGDAMGDSTMEGTITTINPEIDPASRNVKVQATLANPQELLRPGMFVDVAVLLPQQREVLVIPTTAVLYAPYSDSVFVIEKKKDEKTGTDGLVLRQQFVRLGEKRGDFVAVLSGIDNNAEVVSTGVFKLRNGQSVVIDNTLTPKFQLAPTPENE